MLQKGTVIVTKRNSNCYEKDTMVQKGTVNVTKRTKPCYQKDTMLQKGPNNVTKRNIDLIVRSFVRSFCIRRVEIRYYVYSKHKIGLQPIQRAKGKFQHFERRPFVTEKHHVFLSLRVHARNVRLCLFVTPVHQLYIFGFISQHCLRITVNDNLISFFYTVKNDRLKQVTWMNLREPVKNRFF